MEEKPQASSGGGFSGKLSGLYNKLFGVIQFTLGICLLPFAYSSTLAFFAQFNAIEASLQGCFWAGVITFLIIYHFAWEPLPVYTKGHHLLELIFNFFKPLVKVAPFLLPVYTIVLFILFGIASAFTRESWLFRAGMFSFGLSIVLHLVFSSKSMRGKKGDFLKGNYIFGFSLIYILNLFILAFGLSLIFNTFSFVDFSNATYSVARDIFYAVFKQLFLR